MVGDYFGKGDLVFYGRELEFGNIVDFIVVGGVFVFDSGVFCFVFIFFVGFDEVFGGFGFVVDDGGMLFIERGEFGEEFFFELKDFFLEFGFEFGVFFLDVFEIGDMVFDFGRE